MKYSTIWMASCAIGAFAGMAQADCATDLARFTDTAAVAGASSTPGGDAEGIAKDGSLAPLEQPAGDGAQSDTADTAAEPASDMPAADTADGGTSDGIAKDGSLAPLEETDAEPGTAVAMSGSDVQAQQDGQPTAAEEADATGPTPDRDALIAEAQTALAAGDEAACQAAVDQLATM